MAIRLTGATVALLVTLSGAMASAYQARYMSHTGVAFHIPTSDPGIELRILQTVRYGRRVSIAIYNPGRTAVRFRPHCGTMTMRNALGLFLELDHRARLKKKTWNAVTIPPRRAVEVCVWDQKTSLEIPSLGSKRYRQQVDEGPYTAYLSGRVGRGSVLLPIGGYLQQRFRIVKPTHLTLGQPTRIAKGQIVETADGQITLHNGGASALILVGGGHRILGRLIVELGTKRLTVGLRVGETSNQIPGYSVTLMSSQPYGDLSLGVLLRKRASHHP